MCPLTLSGSQTALLAKGTIQPSYLVTITSTSGTLRFCNDKAVTYLGDVYQPYIAEVGSYTTSASFPENQTGNKELSLSFRNDPITLNGTDYSCLSKTFDAFDWELSDCDVKILLTDEGHLAEDYAGNDALPLITSGIVGSPQGVNRQGFIVPIATRNLKLNDGIKLRAVSIDDFPEADPDELNGRTYLPIVVGSGVRVRAIATGAGATTTVTEEVSTGTVLKVSDTTGFQASDIIIIAGLVDDPITIGTVDSANSQFTGLSPNLSTLGTTIRVGDVVREDKASYNYTVADHVCGDATQVFVDDILIDSSFWTKASVADTKAIGGFRTEIQINELITFGASGGGEVTQQPTHTVDNGNHNHAVSVTQESTSISFAGVTSPAGASAANDGNEETSFTLNPSPNNVVTYDSFTAVGGTFSRQRYYAILENATGAGGDETRLRRGTTNFLIIAGTYARGQFRSSSDNGGTSVSTWNVIWNPNAGVGTAQLHEGWKEVTVNPSTSEATRNLANTTRTVDVAINVTGANLDVGEKVEVVIDGIQANLAIFGSGTIQRPDYIMRWFLQQLLSQTAGIINLTSYSSSGSQYNTNGIRLAFVLDQPIKLDTLFDQIAEQSQSIHYWGREGHTLKYLRPSDDLEDATTTLIEDQKGIISIDWRNSFSALDIRNKLQAYFGRNWVETTTKDEAYTGLVTGQDTASQARYGIITNEINGGSSIFLFDFIVDQSQAEDIISFVVGDKATPKKEFTIEGAWSPYELEPGDVVNISTDTLTNTIQTRVLENSIDSKMFCRLLTKEVGSVGESGGEGDVTDHQACISFDGSEEALADLAVSSIGIADAWSIGLWYKLDAPEEFATLVEIASAGSGPNAIRLDIGGFDILGLQITLYNSSSVLKKHYIYDAFFSTAVWQHLVVTWNGTDLKAYRDATLVAAGTLIVDDAITMTATSRKLAVGTQFTGAGVLSSTPNTGVYYDGKLFSLSIWGRPLTADEITAIYNDGNGAAVNLAANRGDYTSSTDLQHWYRFGKNPASLGEDSGLGTAKTLSTEQNMDSGNVVSDFPS